MVSQKYVTLYLAIAVPQIILFYVQIIAQDFFDVPLPEMSNFDPASVSIHFQVHMYNFCDIVTKLNDVL